MNRGLYLLILLLFLACGVSQSAEELWQSSEKELNARKYKRAMRSLERLVKTYPDHALAPRAQFQIGDIYMNNMDDIENSLEAYQETATRYPEADEGVKALFMIGFVNANHLEDYDAAQKAYLDFIHRYPNHELIPSVRFELENLGKPVEEIENLKAISNAS
ncbi:MAG: tetratricopeptide repeat protein [Fidelibacterota bacterium]|nr:MAG: tetratricopeptide repeat protein [Candidatus Neomarinimicrobiota bacterium]